MVNLGAKTTTGAFTASMTGLTPGTTYFVRAFATNGLTSYGNEVTFTADTVLSVTAPGSITYPNTDTIAASGGLSGARYHTRTSAVVVR